MILDARTTIGTLAVTLSLGALALVHADGDHVAPLDATLASACTSTASRTCGIDRRLHPDRRSPVPAVTPLPAPTLPPAAGPPAPPTVPTGWPDAGSTGVPNGTALTAVPGARTSGRGWTWNADYRCVLVTGAGATLDALDIDGCVEVSAPDVTIRDTSIRVPADAYWGVAVRHVGGTVIRDCDIYSPTRTRGGMAAVKDVYRDTSITVLRSDLRGWATGVQLTTGLVRDNYIHDPSQVEDDHTHGIASGGGSVPGQLVVRHNTVVNPRRQSDAISLVQEFGLIQDIVIDDNLVAGGGYTVYGGGGSFGVARHVTVTGNLFSTQYYARGGYWGPVTRWDLDASNTWTGNVWADGARAGREIPQP